MLDDEILVVRSGNRADDDDTAVLGDDDAVDVERKSVVRRVVGRAVAVRSEGRVRTAVGKQAHESRARSRSRAVLASGDFSGDEDLAVRLDRDGARDVVVGAAEIECLQHGAAARERRIEIAVVAYARDVEILVAGLTQARSDDDDLAVALHGGCEDLIVRRAAGSAADRIAEASADAEAIVEIAVVDARMGEARAERKHACRDPRQAQYVHLLSPDPSAKTSRRTVASHSAASEGRSRKPTQKPGAEIAN